MKNTQKGFIIPLIIAIVALIAVGGGVYLYNSSQTTITDDFDWLSDIGDDTLDDEISDDSQGTDTTNNNQIIADKNNTDSDDDIIVACTMDAMQCPDGSWVGRTGPDCEFVCPEDEPTTDSSGTVTIEGFYTRPTSVNNQEEITIRGLSKGEYVRIEINGAVRNFEHFSVVYNENLGSLVKDTVLNKIDSLENQIIIIETIVPGGIPSEKITWNSLSGKSYEITLAESGIDGRLYAEFTLE